jgi:5-methylcytosine-specific restriction endonuclease McrA
MIYVDRNKVPVPAILIDPAGKAAEEISKAITHFTSADKDKPFEFKVYGDKTVKKALTLLFNGKCAYCENKITAITTGDIEHFRPKSQVKRADNTLQKPGYFWLAASWENLLLSCNNCNRKTTQEVVDGSELAMGKLDQFPLLDEKWRCAGYIKSKTRLEKKLEKDEKARLLINPCVDNPEEHLFFQDNGVPMAKQDPVTKQSSLKGEKSIEVYALFRKPLVDERKELIKDILLRIAQAKEMFEGIVEARKSGSKVLEKKFDGLLNTQIGSLAEMTQPDKRFSALAKQLIIPFLKENGML